MSDIFAYDEVSYPASPLPGAHPRRLASIAHLLGVTSAPLNRCRVLEIGCSDGGHLIPMALALPESSFLGIDLSTSAIELARRAIDALQLNNIGLEHADLRAWDPGTVQFDYIVAHGFYSWTPPPVRDRLLALVGRHLSPYGVAFVSYNLYPGSYLRQMLSGMMRFHVDDAMSPAEKIAASRSLLRFLNLGQRGQESGGALLGRETMDAMNVPDQVIYHDYLSPVNDPVYFHEFMAHAARHGLQYLAESEFHTLSDDRFPAEVRRVLAQMDFLTREQYLDFLRCRRFRQTLLVRANLPIERDVPLRRMKAFAFSSDLRPVSAAPSLAPGVRERFEAPGGGSLEVDHALCKRALLILAGTAPRLVAFDALLASARAQTGAAPDSLAEDTEALAYILLAACRSGVVDFQLHPAAWAGRHSARPVASPLVRWQIAQGRSVVTTLRHVATNIDDPVERWILPKLDGSREREALVRELNAAVTRGELALDPGVDPASALEDVLNRAADAALLVE